MNARRWKRPMLIVISAPSGGGKTTLCDRLMADYPDLAYSVSCTTRSPRGNEVDGQDYFFLTPAEFDRRIHAGLFLEHAVVHGHQYGTPREPVREILAQGRSVVMDIDVQGAARIREQIGQEPPGGRLKRSFVDVFIAPPSVGVLKERLLRRGEDTPETIERRLANAQSEMDSANRYRYIVVNDDLDRAYRELTDILDREGDCDE